MSSDDPINSPMFTAAIDLLGRTGASGFQIRYDDDPEPTVWIALSEYKRNGKLVYEAAAGMHPLSAVLRLCETLIDGGRCAHCKRTSGFSEEIGQMPLADGVCWYQWDPEMKTFRRGCEGGIPA